MSSRGQSKAHHANANTLACQRVGVQGVSTTAKESQNKTKRWDKTEGDIEYGTGANS